MKKFLVIFIAVNVIVGALVVGALVGTVYLAETAPFGYASPFYGLQKTAESWRLRLDGNALRRTEFALELVERRLADLAHAQDAAEITASAETLNGVLNTAIRGIDAAPAGSQDALFARLDILLQQTASLVTALENAADQPAVAALSEKLNALQAAETREELVEAVPPAPALAAEIIPFLSRDVDHETYALEGGHVDAECEACHTDGEYKGTPRECVDCHRTAVNGFYPQHFAGECTDCHVVDSWEPTQFDHLIVAECQSCHAEDTPPEHYILADPSVKFLASLVAQPSRTANTPPDEDLVYKPCVRCHTNTSDWEQAVFDHFTFNDCAACHEEEDTPAEHYPGQCSDCHIVDDWESVWFNHAGFPDCASCHTAEVANHYPGQCSDCHITDNWTTIRYTHLAQSVCTHCHTGDRPEIHYLDNCDRCHNTEDWAAVDFDHTGQTDCTTCHTEANHYLSQCSSCHTTSNWGDIRFDHGGLTNCEDCHNGANPPAHYAGACSSCHTTSRWEDVTFKHGEYKNCVDCHSDDAPSKHYSGQCSACHTTSDWQQIKLDHSGDRPCEDCHAEDAPGDGHFYAVCGDCHSIAGWGVVHYDHRGVEPDTCTTCHESPEGHYPDACATCHTTESWDFAHQIVNDCASCHTKDGHWPGECSLCHESVVDWNVYTFNHESGNYNDCKACHARPTGHPRGQCSKCHDTGGWGNIITAVPDVPASAGAPPERPAAPTEGATPPPPPRP